MHPAAFIVPLDWLDPVGEVLPFVILALVVVNAGTRLLAHRRNHEQADAGGDDAMSRYLPHAATNVALVLAGLLFLVHAPHAGVVMSVLVFGMLLADLFEYEARQVEARNDLGFERPKAALAAWTLVFLYALFQSITVFGHPWGVIV